MLAMQACHWLVVGDVDQWKCAQLFARVSARSARLSQTPGCMVTTCKAINHTTKQLGFL